MSLRHVSAAATPPAALVGGGLGVGVESFGAAVGVPENVWSDPGLETGTGGLAGGVRRVVEGGGGRRGGQDAAADHVDRGMHAGHDAGLGQVEGGRHEFLETLGDRICVSQSGRMEGVGVAAREAGVVGRGGAALSQQLRRHDDRRVVDREAEVDKIGFIYTRR